MTTVTWKLGTRIIHRTYQIACEQYLWSTNYGGNQTFGCNKKEDEESLQMLTSPDKEDKWWEDQMYKGEEQTECCKPAPYIMNNTNPYQN